MERSLTPPDMHAETDRQAGQHAWYFSTAIRKPTSDETATSVTDSQYATTDDRRERERGHHGIMSQPGGRRRDKAATRHKAAGRLCQRLRHPSTVVSYPRTSRRLGAHWAKLWEWQRPRGAMVPSVEPRLPLRGRFSRHLARHLEFLIE